MNDLRELAGGYGLSLTEKELEQFEIYTERLLAYNQKVNLTAITDREEMAVKHYLDSLLPLHAFPFLQGARVIDVGTGAGFPGVPLKIVRDDLALTLLDSLNKRLDFLRELSDALGQENDVVHGRAEQLAHHPDYRERFAIVLSRAVASLPALAEYCMAYLEPGGCFLALKGPDGEEEAKAAEKAIGEMGGKLEEVKRYSLPGGSKRSILLIRKISQTPPKYPRKRVNIAKTPLG